MENLNKNIQLKYLLFFLLLLKILWIMITSLQYVTQTYYDIHSYDYIIEYTEEIIHNIYNIMMGLLLVYLFHHFTTKSVCISGHTKQYLYMYGILMIIGNFQQLLHLKWFYPFIR